MPGNDELSVDLAEAAAQAQQDVNADIAVEQAINPETPSPVLEETIEVDNDQFWNDGEDELDLASEEPEDSEEQPAADLDSEDVPDDDSRIISYKVNGKDVTLDLEEVRSNPELRAQLAKDLALVGGAKKAFSKSAVLQKENRTLKRTLKETEEFKKAWNKLEDIKDDEDRVFEVITGRSLDEVVAERAERHARYHNASEEDRKIMEYEDRIRQMEVQNKRESERRAKELADIDAKQFQTEKQAVATDLRREAAKYEFDGVDNVQANRLRKMLWQGAIDDIRRYTNQGYKFNEKMIAKAFRDNASALQGFYKKSVDKGVQEVTAKRKAEAKEKAGQAATKHYKKEKIDSNLVSKDPLSVFRAFRRGNK